MKRSVHRFFGIALVAATLLGAGSCLDTPDVEDPRIQLQKDIATIDNYMLTEGIYAYQEDEYYKIRFVIKKLGFTKASFEKYLQEPSVPHSNFNMSLSIFDEYSILKPLKTIFNRK